MPKWGIMAPTQHQSDGSNINQRPMIYLVDDDPAIRESLLFLLESVGHRARSYPSGEAFLEETRWRHPGCVLLDLRMPGLSGLQTQRALNERHLFLPIIFITGHGDTTSAVRAMKEGAFDFLEKPFSEKELLETVEKALASDEALASRHADQAIAKERMDRLSSRERDVLAYVIKGLVSKSIAEHLCISARTVEAHRNSIMRKFEVKNVAELVRIAVSAEPDDRLV